LESSLEGQYVVPWVWNTATTKIRSCLYIVDSVHQGIHVTNLIKGGPRTFLCWKDNIFILSWHKRRLCSFTKK